jgi:hypothetical protein
MGRGPGRNLSAHLLVDLAQSHASTQHFLLPTLIWLPQSRPQLRTLREQNYLLRLRRAIIALLARVLAEISAHRRAVGVDDAREASQLEALQREAGGAESEWGDALAVIQDVLPHLTPGRSLLGLERWGAGQRWGAGHQQGWPSATLCCVCGSMGPEQHCRAMDVVHAKHCCRLLLLPTLDNPR